MEAEYSSYDFAASRQRIDDIFSAGEAEALNSIPPRSKLTYTNGFYVNCTALFVDMRDSSGLTAKHQLPTLARLYRSYISELSAILRSTEQVREINIHGDAVWAVYDTPLKEDVSKVFSVAAMANTLVQIISHKHQRKGLSAVKAGLGMAYGRALMVKAGQKGSGHHDVVWMGDVVNSAAHLSGYGAKTASDRPIMVTKVVRRNLTAHQKGLLEWNSDRACYHGNVVNRGMKKWLKDQG